MRWALTGDQPQAMLRSDPGYALLVDSFANPAKKAGFGHEMRVGSGIPLLGYSVDRRYYLSPERKFPLLQIGPGIFASNQSTEYSWTDFQKQAVKGAQILLSSYPYLKSFEFRLVHLELRYIDVFEKSLLGSLDLPTFTNSATELNVTLPIYLEDKKMFRDAVSGRLLFIRNLKTIKDSKFFLDLASGSRDADEIIRLETKIVTLGAGLPKAVRAKKNADWLTDWLEQAHDVLSPFFKSFVKPAIMSKFQ